MLELVHKIEDLTMYWQLYRWIYGGLLSSLAFQYFSGLNYALKSFLQSGFFLWGVVASSQYKLFFSEDR